MSEVINAKVVEQETAVIPVPQYGMIRPAVSVEEAVEAFNQYQQLKNTLGTEDDFVQIGKKKHPMKSFVRKMQRFFNISCELIKDEPVYEKEEIVSWIATARAIHLQSGVYQDADGSCSFKEKMSAQKTLHNVRAHAVTRAKNRAILDLVGFGDVSGEEINEIDREPQKQEPTPPPAPVKKPLSLMGEFKALKDRYVAVCGNVPHAENAMKKVATDGGHTKITPEYVSALSVDIQKRESEKEQ